MSVGRRIPSESHFAGTPYVGPPYARRREVLRETLAAFEGTPGREHYARHAEANLGLWSGEAGPALSGGEVRVLPGDWGEVVGALTREFGVTFAALNMANAFAPGGAYVEGTAAQEENMFRRTDCHFSIRSADLAPGTELYTDAMRSLLEAKGGRVYLDTVRPRLCIRGPEDQRSADLGYRFLGQDEVFPFFELRAAAQDLRGGAPFDLDDARARIRAQIDTLRDAGVRHAVLGAFGCGAFRNPAGAVARLYREEIEASGPWFAVLAFAIYDPGYGPDNFTPFAEVFRSFGSGPRS